ncbi:glycosyltransferase [Flavobacterium ginsenosidimutans]|uniref:glycosyltransferase n=1 Tax=Flavobacterium ginsenosidimutans TaxID=687844 RepID=UPI000DAC58D0|nr:glycosyltransferase [Flavobacterium ginsenosidimutans]KAF2334181.1 glycosyltransferase family 4 protein [Flavobacterium ginsenosidimutans]
MKILMVSIPSLHFFRWVNQLQDSGHEVYWFDITGMGGKNKKLSWIDQKSNWKVRWDFPGRIQLKSKFPLIYRQIQRINEKETAKKFEEYLLQIQPDVVHSFALYLSCAPIISIMEKYNSQKWIYSSWGSDLFYFQNEPNYLKDIKRILPRVNFLFTDCYRDFQIAQRHGFNGKLLGVFPGPGGIDLEEIEKFKMPKYERNTILIKGFQGRSGRVIPVLKALEKLENKLKNFKIIVFGSDIETFDYLNKSPLKKWNNFKAIGKINHEEVFKLMGESLLYIGNSNSDGMPNTLLEAISMEVYPIQSNPGKATQEIIQNEMQGLLIENCEDIDEIKTKVEDGILFISKNNYNPKELLKGLEYHYVKNKVLEQYNSIIFP